MRTRLPIWLTYCSGLPIIAFVIWFATTQPAPGPRSSAVAPRAAASSSHAMTERYGKLPLAFEPNVGQTDAHVKFLARGSGYTVFLTDTAAFFTMRPPTNPRAALQKGRRPPASATIRMSLKGARRDAGVAAFDPQPGVSNYAIGNDPAVWHTSVPHFGRVRSNGVYPGIDVVYYGNQRQLEHDFVVAPGADPGRIAFDVDGADRLEIDGDGALVMGIGAEQVRLNKPYAYQGADGDRREIASAYALQGNHTVRLRVADYDRSRPLVIDPVLVYTADVGGTSVEFATSVAADASGNAYLTGITGSNDFPATPGVAQGSFGGGTGTVVGQPADAFVAKMNPAGTALIYATYLGGAGDDLGIGIAVDEAGNAYIAGVTAGVNATTNNFPTTAGAYRETYQGGDFDAFVTKLNSSGQLAYSTYVGGPCGDQGYAIALDAAHNVYIGGQTDGSGTSPCVQNFPVTPGALQTTFDPTGTDAIFAKLNPTGSTLLYATYLGGVTGPDEVDGIAVDTGGNAYVTGSTSSSDFPTTVGAYQTVFGGGTCGTFPCRDAFVSKVNPAGNGAADLVYSTYLGKTQREEAHGIAVDATGNSYVVGETQSPDFPTTAGAYQRTFAFREVFVTKLNPSGGGLVFSTLFGGNGDDLGAAIALDASLNIHIAGQTSSGNLPTTADALSGTINGSDGSGFICDTDPASGGTGCDGFVAKLNPAGTVLIYGTYLGGPGEDVATGVAVQGANVFVSGATTSSFLARPSGQAPSLSGPLDATVTKLALPSVGFTDDPVRAGATGPNIKALHITELRSRIDAARIAHGLGAYTYTDPTLIPGSTIAKAAHINDLRTALGAAYTAAGLTPPDYITDPVLTAGVRIRAAHINQLRRAVINLESGLGFAAYDGTTYMTAACLQSGPVCDSSQLFVGRDTITGGIEFHQPSTIANSCADGTSGTLPPSNNRLRVFTLDGTPFALGKTVRIEAFVNAAGTTNHLDLYYAASAASPSWTFLTTIDATSPGLQTMSATYMLPSGAFQAVRARFRSGGSAMPCTVTAPSSDDHDDLVFKVNP